MRELNLMNKIIVMFFILGSNMLFADAEGRAYLKAKNELRSAENQLKNSCSKAYDNIKESIKKAEEFKSKVVNLKKEIDSPSSLLDSSRSKVSTYIRSSSQFKSEMSYCNSWQPTLLYDLQERHELYQRKAEKVRKAQNKFQRKASYFNEAVSDYNKAIKEINKKNKSQKYTKKSVTSSEQSPKEYKTISDAEKACEDGDGRGCGNAIVRYLIKKDITENERKKVLYLANKGCYDNNSGGVCYILVDFIAKENLEKRYELLVRSCNLNYADACDKVNYLNSLIE